MGLSIGALVLITVLLWQPGGRIGESRLLRTGLSLILGGSLGNVYDRVVSGTVTDFLDFYLRAWHWPAFNLADSAITVGAALVVLEMLRSKRPAPQSRCCPT